MQSRYGLYGGEFVNVDYQKDKERELKLKIMFAADDGEAQKHRDLSTKIYLTKDPKEKIRLSSEKLALEETILKGFKAEDESKLHRSYPDMH